MGLKPGIPVPDFTLPDQEGKMFSSADYAGKQPMVIFFYPKDHTPGCTMEVCAFRDSYEDFTAQGAVVAGISSDSEASHRKFAGAHGLPFRLLSDKDGKVRSRFRVKGTLFNLIPGRETFVVDANGIIRFVFNGMNAAQHMGKALQALQDNNR